MNYKFYIFLGMLLFPFCTSGQVISGIIKSPDSTPCIVHFSNGLYADSILSNVTGGFFIPIKDTGRYLLRFQQIGCESYFDTVIVSDKYADFNLLDTIFLFPKFHELKQVDIKKVVLMLQNQDTTTFNPDVFKIGPNSDMVSLLNKLPGMEASENSIRFRNKGVGRVLIDGKALLGQDFVQTLNLFPNDLVKSIKVYGESNDSNLLNSNDSKSFTINIITKSEVSNSRFGSLNTGVGIDNSHRTLHTVGGNLSAFSDKRRLTVTVGENNMNSGTTGLGTRNLAPANTMGYQSISAGAINFNDSIGKKTSLTVMASINKLSNAISNEFIRRFFNQGDSLQTYREYSGQFNNSYIGQIKMKSESQIGRHSTLAFQASTELKSSKSENRSDGETERNSLKINQTNNQSSGSSFSPAMQFALNYKKRFLKPGRSFSISSGFTNLRSNIKSELQGLNQSNPSQKSDSISQVGDQSNLESYASVEVNYLEPINSTTNIKLSNFASYFKSQIDKTTIRTLDSSNKLLNDSSLSGFSSTARLYQKFGISVVKQYSRLTMILGASHLYTNTVNVNFTSSEEKANQHFSNYLLNGELVYKFTSSKSLRTTYTTGINSPTPFQLQDVLNNSDPLHVTIGNSALIQALRHTIEFRFSYTNNKTYESFDLSSSLLWVRNNITTSTTLVVNDSFLRGNIMVPSGATLSYPINIQGFYNTTVNLGYSIPIKRFRSNFGAVLELVKGNNPGLVNGKLNNQTTHSFLLKLKLTSNISEKIDFNILSSISSRQNQNSVNPASNRVYTNINLTGNVSLTFSRFYCIATFVNFRSSLGLGTYNQDGLLASAALSKKILRNRLLELSVAVVDIFNQNNSVRYTVGSDYEQITRTSVLGRYYVFSATLKFRNFRGSERSSK